MAVLLTTTGTSSPIVISDFGAMEFIHPVVNYDLTAEFTYQEIRDSSDLGTALDAGYVSITNDGVTVANSAELKEVQPVVSSGIEITEGSVEITSTLVLSGGLQFGAAITININSNTNNLVIPNLSSGVLVRLNTTGNYSLSGITISDTTKGQWIKISNVGTGKLTLKDNDIGSTASFRFLMGSNKSLQPNENIGFIYDTVSLRLRPDGINI